MEMIVRARVHLIFKMLFILNLALNNKTETSLNAIVYTTFSVQKKKKKSTELILRGPSAVVRRSIHFSLHF